ncbi:MAG: cupin domain-containing protein [Acidimicrobiales bacterium]|jgi:mannose-6-phosphate isomerase-like protein (cupin superfamily)
MIHVREADLDGVRVPTPHSRTIKHAIAPWGQGSEAIWVGFALVDEGSTSNRHHHDNEEIFIVMEGEGRICVGDESVEVAPGSVVRVPPTTDHQLVNRGEGVFKVAAIASPAFEKSYFDIIHLIEDAERTSS